MNQIVELEKRCLRSQETAQKSKPVGPAKAQVTCLPGDNDLISAPEQHPAEWPFEVSCASDIPATDLSRIYNVESGCNSGTTPIRFATVSCFFKACDAVQSKVGNFTPCITLKSATG